MSGQRHWTALLCAAFVASILAPSSFAATSAPAAQPAPAAKAPAAKPAPSATPAPSQADAMSTGIIEELTTSMGGQQTWDRLPYLRFDFVVVQNGKEVARFKHWWDKQKGRCRVEGPDDKGRSVAAIFNLADKKGKAFVDGLVETDPAAVAGIIKDGYERWVNDTYWLVMPFKLRDPGTQVKHVRIDRNDDGTTHDVLALSFAPDVGLTPQDHYWLYVNRQTHLIDKWEYVLTGQKPPPQASSWESWTSVGPIQFSTARRFEGKPVMLRFENVATPSAMDESVFTQSKPRG